jgi:hypothetical protein
VFLPPFLSSEDGTHRASEHFTFARRNAHTLVHASLHALTSFRKCSHMRRIASGFQRSSADAE